MTYHIRKALVTGGSGFIGAALIRKLLDAGIEVHNLDLNSDGTSHAGLKFFQGSFLDRKDVRESLSEVDCVFHLAATGFAREANANPLQDAKENIVGTIALLDEAISAGVRRFVFCSSGGTVYGSSSPDPIHETDATNPISAYGISKLACEKYMRLYNGAQLPGDESRKFSTITLRVSNPYGAGQNIRKAQGALTTFSQRIMNAEPVEIWGDGTVERDYIDVRDVANALIKAARRISISGTEINIGSGQATSLNDLIREISALLGVSADVRYHPKRSFDVARNVLDISAARELLDWVPEVPLREGIRKLIHDLHEDVARAPFASPV